MGRLTAPGEYIHSVPLSEHERASPHKCLFTLQENATSERSYYQKDTDLRIVYDMQKCMDRKKVRKWTPTAELEKVEGMVSFDKKFSGGQSSRLGLGFIKKKQLKDPLAQHRRDITSKLRALDEEERLVKVYGLAMQGKWTSWDDVMELDLSWKNLIYALPPKLTSFALNAIGLTLPTPD